MWSKKTVNCNFDMYIKDKCLQGINFRLYSCNKLLFCLLHYFCTRCALISIPVCLFILDKIAGWYCYENILTITFLLINEIQIFFLLCTILTKSFSLIIIFIVLWQLFQFLEGVLLLGFFLILQAVKVKQIWKVSDFT